MNKQCEDEIKLTKLIEPEIDKLVGEVRITVVNKSLEFMIKNREAKMYVNSVLLSYFNSLGLSMMNCGIRLITEMTNKEKQADALLRMKILLKEEWKRITGEEF